MRKDQKANTIYNRKYRAEHLERTRESARNYANSLKGRDWRYKYLYGIGVEDYEKLLASQGGVCAICKHPPMKRRLGVDHDHRDKKIRGLLCIHCNKIV